MGIRELRLFAADHHGVFSTKEAAGFDVDGSNIRRRVAAGELIRLDRGVVGVVGVPDSWKRSARVATLSTGGFLSHHSALHLHEVDGFGETIPEVSIPKSRAMRRPDVIIHRTTQFGRAGARMVDGIECSSVERGVLDIAGTTSQRRLEQAVDAVLRQQYCDLPDLFDTWVRHSIQGRNGCGPLRRLLEERDEKDPIPDSRWNRMVGQLLVDALLPTPTYEHDITSASGNFLGRVDLAYPRQRLAIELDSARWHLNRESFEQDPRRKNLITLAGWTVLTFTWSDYIEQPARLVRTVANALNIKAA